MARFYLKNALLQKLCCGDVMISRRRVIVFLVTLAVLTCIFTSFILYTITKRIVYSDNRYMERLREHGSHYKNKIVDRGAVYLKPFQDTLNDHLQRQQYDKKLENAYNHVAANVDTFRGKADTVIKQVRKDPNKYAVDSGKQVMGYVQDTGQQLGESLQEAGKQSVESLQKAGKQSLDAVQEAQKDTQILVEDIRANPNKYADKAKQHYADAYNKLGEGANQLGVQANRALNGAKDAAHDLQQQAAQGLREIERQIDRARS